MESKVRFPLPHTSTATRYLQNSLRYTNTPTRTKDRALRSMWQRSSISSPRMAFASLAVFRALVREVWLFFPAVSAAGMRMVLSAVQFSLLRRATRAFI